MIKVSEKCLQSIASFEALALTAYQDSHHLAIGFGGNDPNVFEGMTIDFREAVRRFFHNVKEREIQLQRVFDHEKIDITKLKQQHIDAIFHLGYNVGMGAIRDNKDLLTALHAFIDADKGTAASYRDVTGFEIIKQNMVYGVPFNLARRCLETRMFIRGDYGDLSTLQFWDRGKAPKGPHAVPAEVIPMPNFIR